MESAQVEPDGYRFECPYCGETNALDGDTKTSSETNQCAYCKKPVILHSFRRSIENDKG